MSHLRGDIDLQTDYRRDSSRDAAYFCHWPLARSAWTDAGRFDRLVRARSGRSFFIRPYQTQLLNFSESLHGVRGRRLRRLALSRPVEGCVSTIDIRHRHIEGDD
jgi:hypothetical protein